LIPAGGLEIFFPEFSSCTCTYYLFHFHNKITIIKILNIIYSKKFPPVLSIPRLFHLHNLFLQLALHQSPHQHLKRKFIIHCLWFMNADGIKAVL